MNTILRKKTGVGIIIKRDSLLLLGKRISSLGNGTWAPPGGLIEPNETMEQAAVREVAEETALIISNVTFIASVENIFSEQNRFAESLMLEACYIPGKLINNEPHKCEQWAWFEWNHLPSPLFPPFESFINQGYLDLIFQ